MKWLLLLSLLPFNLSAQTEIRDSIKYLTFKVDFPADTLPDSDSDEIDFGREQPESVFILEGKTPLTYKMKLVNDTIASLLILKASTWQLQENMYYQSDFLWREDRNLLHSEYAVTDFDSICVVLIQRIVSHHQLPAHWNQS